MAWPWRPLHRVYRAFDHLPERAAAAECARVLRRDRAGMVIDACSFGLCAMLATSLASCLVTAWMAAMLREREAVWAVPIMAAGAIVTVLVVSYLAAAWRYQRLGAAVLADRLGPMNNVAWNICSKCSYPLNDLPVEDDRVRCPECGETFPWIERP